MEFIDPMAVKEKNKGEKKGTGTCAGLFVYRYGWK